MFPSLFKNTKQMKKADVKEFEHTYEFRIYLGTCLIKDDDALNNSGGVDVVDSFQRAGKSRDGSDGRADVTTSKWLTTINMRTQSYLIEDYLTIAYGSKIETINDLSKTARKVVKDLNARVAMNDEHAIKTGGH